MRETIGVVVALLTATGIVFAQGPPKPTPAPEHKRLAYFAGTWNFVGEAKASPMGPAGAMTFKEDCELMEGGFALVCRSEGKTPMGPSKSHSIMSYDVEKKAYTYTAAENNMPVFTALGKVSGPTWTWNTESKMGTQVLRTRVTIKENGPTSYDFSMEMGMNAAQLAPIVQGKITKAGT
jgi:hypothetical protein